MFERCLELMIGMRSRGEVAVGLRDRLLCLDRDRTAHELQLLRCSAGLKNSGVQMYGCCMRINSRKADNNSDGQCRALQKREFERGLLMPVRLIGCVVFRLELP